MGKKSNKTGKRGRGFGDEAEYDDPQETSQSRKKSQNRKNSKEVGELQDEAIAQYIELSGAKKLIDEARAEVDVVAEAAVQETMSLIPGGSTEIQEASIEKSNEAIRAVQAETHDALDNVAKELDEEVGKPSGPTRIKSAREILDSSRQKNARERLDDLRQKKSAHTVYSSQDMAPFITPTRRKVVSVGRKKTAETQATQPKGGNSEESPAEITPTPDSGDQDVSPNKLSIESTIDSGKAELRFQLDYIEQVLKRDIDVKLLKSRSDSQTLQSFLTALKNNIEHSTTNDDIAECREKIGVVQSILKEYVDQKKTFDFKEFIAISNERIRSKSPSKTEENNSSDDADKEPNPEAEPNNFTLRVGSFEKMGTNLFKSSSEDTLLREEKLQLFGVFDGVGGEKNGKITSQTAATAIRSYYDQFPSSPVTSAQALITAWSAISQARSEVLQKVGSKGEGATTAVFAKIESINNHPHLVWANAGDSRLFIFGKDRNIREISTDQSVANRVYNNLGSKIHQFPFPDHPFYTLHKDEFGIIPLAAGDRIMICSDGITGDTEPQFLSDEEKLQAFTKLSPDECAEDFFRLSKKKYDDQSIIVIDVEGSFEFRDNTNLEENIQSLTLELIDNYNICEGLITSDKYPEAESAIEKIQSDIEELLTQLAQPDISQDDVDDIALRRLPLLDEINSYFDGEHVVSKDTASERTSPKPEEPPSVDGGLDGLLSWLPEDFTSEDELSTSEDTEKDPLTQEDLDALLKALGEEIHTIPFTDAAGKKVDLKVGDKLYWVKPDESKIETCTIEELDFNLGMYCIDGEWDHGSYERYSDISDAEEALAKINRPEVQSESHNQPEPSSDVADGVDVGGVDDKSSSDATGEGMPSALENNPSIEGAENSEGSTEETPLDQIALRLELMLQSTMKIIKRDSWERETDQLIKKYETHIEQLNVIKEKIKLTNEDEEETRDTLKQELLDLESEVRRDFLYYHGYNPEQESNLLLREEDSKEALIEDVDQYLVAIFEIGNECQASFNTLPSKNDQLRQEDSDLASEWNSLTDRARLLFDDENSKLEDLRVFKNDLKASLERHKDFLERLTVIHIEEAQKEFEKLSPTDQQKVSLGIRNIGFKAKEQKSKLFASIFDKFKSDKSSIGRLIGALAQTYRHDAENAQRLIELAESRKDTGDKLGLAKSRAMSMATTVGMVAKVGSFAFPFRLVMMGAMGAARLSEAGKEAVLAGTEKITLDTVEAQKELEVIKLIAARNSSTNGNEASVSEQDMDQAMQENLTSNLRRRLKRSSNLRQRFKRPDYKRELEYAELEEYQDQKKGFNLIKHFAQWETNRLIKKIRWQIVNIDRQKDISSEKKKQAKAAVLRKYVHHLKDLDRMVSEYGKVNAWAAGLKYAEKGLKGAVTGMTIGTVYLSVEHLYDWLTVGDVDSDVLVPPDQLSAEPSIPLNSKVSPDTAIPTAGTSATPDVITPPAAPAVAEAPAAPDPVVPSPNPAVVPDVVSAPPVASPVIETPSAQIATVEPVVEATSVDPDVSSAGVSEPAPTPTPTPPPTPTSQTPIGSPTPVEDFTKAHALYENTGAEITGDSSAIKVEYEIGSKGDFATLDQALRRVVAQEISIGADGKFDAIEATRAENVLANLRQLLEGKAVGDIKPDALQGIVEFKDGKLTIIDYQKFDEFMDGKLFARAAEKISEANLDTGYAKISVSKWQEMFDQRSEKPTIDLGSAPTAEVAPESPIASTVDTSSSVASVITPESAPPTIDTVDTSPEPQLPTPEPSASVIEPKPFSEPESVVVVTTPYPVEYMSEVLDQMPDEQASALAEVMQEAGINADKWEDINFIIDGNTDLLQNADGEFDVNQVELALELSKVPRPKPAELRLALEAMKVLNFEQAQEVAIVNAIINPKQGPEALKELFGDSSGNSNAKVTLNSRNGLLHFRNLGPEKLDGTMNFRKGYVRIGKVAGAIFGGKFELKNLIAAIKGFN
jgi:serine/threonine protein phosphatase PrpC